MSALAWLLLLALAIGAANWLVLTKLTSRPLSARYRIVRYVDPIAVTLGLFAAGVEWALAVFGGLVIYIWWVLWLTRYDPGNAPE